MDGQLQQLGPVSEVCKREETILNAAVVTDREKFLKESLQVYDA